MANLNSSIKIVEVTTVTPPQDSKTPNSLPLTFFDLVWLRSPPTKRLYLYELPTVSTATFFDSVLPKLKHSLSLTLRHFLPLAGNISWPETSPKPLIDYVGGSDDGVSFTVAESDADFYDLSAADINESTASHLLVPDLAVSKEKAAVTALQITVFPNRGFSIGITTHHAVLDGKSSTSFIKAWSHICKIGDQYSTASLPELNLLYDRSVIKDPKGLEAIYVNNCLQSGGPNNKSLLPDHKPRIPSDTVRVTFQLSRVKIEKLREFVKVEMAKRKDQNPHHVSTFSLTVAYTCTCLAKSEGLSSEIELVLISFGVDCRSRLEPPVLGYFGNCMTLKVAFAEAKGVMGKEGFLVAVNAISEAIKSLETDGIFHGAENRVAGKHSLPPFKLYNFSGSPRFEVYNSDFGWGRPTKVDMPCFDTNSAISLSDSKNGDGGVQIGLPLNKHIVEAFASQFAKGLEDLPF
ncbi:malonyl-CoA:anthocyanidin 5-O-glucoside-6''-O-malonyltransferase-like [Ziziphus jujuba]|uniref:Malonyl-CoA:anthocyanidin 5-O-glucoside-6''-O-malonyltransferase-like n=1 Tax=Ziziphus jujuba TaxID=326968 RepID=A0A6P3ZL73_ZIZJJ|nr:malonyl-CoA:anthocyanidin 5-O-glucoside-6''-O-malonyltransferase-like [Ziziphus jujuba]